MFSFLSKSNTKNKNSKDALLKKIAVSPSDELYCELGDIYKDNEEPSEAITAFQSALSLNAKSGRAYVGLGDICMNLGQRDNAVNCYASAMTCEPDNLQYKIKLAKPIMSLAPASYNQQTADMVVDLIKSGALRHCYTFDLWYHLLLLHPDFGDLIKSAEENTYQEFCDKVTEYDKERKILSEPFIVWGVRKIFIGNKRYELFITALRRYLLEKKREDVLDLAVSVSIYCHETDYAFAITEQENELLTSLRSSSEQTELQIVIQACYEHIFTGCNVGQVSKVMSRYPDFIEKHIKIPLILTKNKKDIQSLTPIEGDVTEKIHEQYESFPFPLWSSYLAEIRDKEIEGSLKGKKVKILAGGCGTGREAIEHALNFPDAEITAIDLSRSSLSYAKMKADELGILNINFYQADILQIPDWNNEFDYVSSSGVIHHMDNPAEGLAVLARVLKPGGLMRLGLYSRLARRKITQAQEIIIAGGYGNDREEILNVRLNAKRIFPTEIYEHITLFRDFYSLPELRDMLFNAKEHCLTLQQVKQMLAQENMEFSKFYLKKEVFQQFEREFGGGSRFQDLDLWTKFEENYPDTFINMYAFWCTKKK